MIYIIALSLFAFITAFIIPWVVFCRQNDLETKVRLLTEALLLKRQTPDWSSVEKNSLPPSLDALNNPEPVIISKAYNNNTDYDVITEVSQDFIKEPINIKNKISFEEQFGKNLPVWGGGIALALAAFFLVKYSIDNNLLSPIVRVILGTMFGFGLLHIAKIIRQKDNFANGQRIAQSLAGAGIIALYVVTFAATKLYDLVPLWLGFMGMSAVTATALVMSLRHGMPIAIMALIGGFLTPIFLGGGGHNTLFLFGYLYLMIAGLHYIIKKTQWWWLSIFATLSALAWVSVWLTVYQHGDGIILGLFLIGLCVINILNSRQGFADNIENSFVIENILKPASLLNYISLGGAVILMSIVVNISGFGFLEWGLFGLLAIATIGLAYFNNRVYGFAPWASFGVVCFILLLSLPISSDTVYLLMVIGFCIIYALSSAILVFISRNSVFWACLCGISAVIFYLIGLVVTYRSPELLTHIPLIWGFLAFACASGAIYMLTQVKEKLYDNPHIQYLYAVFATVATSFITLGLYVELPFEFLSVAVATQMLATAWINQRITLKALQALIGVLAVVFGLILLPQFLLMIQLTVYSLTETQWHLQNSMPFVKYPLFQLGIPAVMFLATSYFLRFKKHNPLLVKIFEGVAIALVAIMGYYLTRNLLNPNTNVLFVKAGFFERGLISNALFLYGLLCLWVGRRFNRTTFSWGGIILIGGALFRIIYFDICIYNPLWEYQQIKGVTLLNSLLLPFGLPIIWTYFAQKELVFLDKNSWLLYLDEFKLLILFILLNLNIRYFFHPEFLNIGITQNSEIYSYSVLWLLLGGGLLYAGTLKQDKMMRLCSLGVILLAVAKVFLIDVSELDGLYRVFSFLGLGISLIGVSYFYSRYVFVGNNRN